ncbi:MAG TPA: response regulator [Thermoanaerobaculia bacterium]|nr:response regulator [Thermoanaerobaculia bacterium]
MSIESHATVMVVHHELRVCQLFEEILSKEGYRAVSATNGARALLMAMETRPDIILLDSVMPHLDGLGILRDLRTRGHQGTVILLTAQGTLQGAREAMTLGAYDYITKPFNLDFLKSVLREGLESRLPKRRANVCVH